MLNSWNHPVCLPYLSGLKAACGMTRMSDYSPVYLLFGMLQFITLLGDGLIVSNAREKLIDQQLNYGVVDYHRF